VSRTRFVNMLLYLQSVTSRLHLVNKETYV